MLNFDAVFPFTQTVHSKKQFQKYNRGEKTEDLLSHISF